jgi:hypothetical protein
MCLIGLNLYDHAGYVRAVLDIDHPNRIQWLADGQKVNDALDWIGHGLEPQGVLAATNPALVFMRTGRRAVAFDDPAEERASLKARGVRYIASFLPVDLPDRSLGDYKVRYMGDRLWVIELQ